MTATDRTVATARATGDDAGGFDPSTLQPDSDHPLYYMTQGSFEEHVDDLDGLCRWVDETVAETAGQRRPTTTVHRALLDAGVRTGDGLTKVVTDYCGHGLRPEDHTRMPAGDSTVWTDYLVDCSRYARQELQRDVPAEDPANSPTRSCLDGGFGATVPADDHAFPDALRQWRETSAAADGAPTG